MTAALMKSAPAVLKGYEASIAERAPQLEAWQRAAIEDLMRDANGGVLDSLTPAKFTREVKKAMRLLADIARIAATDGDPDQQLWAKALHRWQHPVAHQLARSFCTLLREEIGEDKLDVVVSRNRQAVSAGTCASHDFTDANMVMDSAFRAVLGRAVDTESDDDRALFNLAWTIAKAEEFSL